MANLFVYGTLIFPELLNALTSKHFKTEDAILEGYHRHQIYDGDIARAYPAIIENKDSFVKGKLIIDVDEESLKILDFFEDKDYTRTAVSINLENEDIPAFTYVWDVRLNHKLKSNWNPHEFEKDLLSIYINDVVPEVLRFYKASS